MNCYLCGSDTKPLFSIRDWLRPQDRNEYPVYWCERCSFGRIGRSLTPVEVQSFYDVTTYYTHDTQVGPDPKASWPQRALRHLAWRFDFGRDFCATELGESRNRTVCDIGCGNGGKLRVLKQRGFKVMGIEPDPVARQIAQEYAEVLSGTAETLPVALSGAKFDIVLMFHVLEHCIDPVTAIGNARRLLEPNGEFIIEVPNNDAAGFGPTWPWLDVPRHLNFFTESSLKKVLVTNGFSVQSVMFTGYVRQFSPSWIATEAAVAAHNMRTRIHPWHLLAQTAFAPANRKYDSIRVYARPADSSASEPVIS